MRDFDKELRDSDTPQVRDRVLKVLAYGLGATEIRKATRQDEALHVDWWAIVPHRPPLGVDLKLRKKQWPDFLIEVVSVIESGQPSWAIDPHAITDYLLVLFPDRHLLIAYPQFRAALLHHLKDWDGLYRAPDSYSRRGGATWSTKTLHVPETILLSAMYPGLQHPEYLPSSEIWKALPKRCATCGSPPSGQFNDGSPRYDCFDPATHRPITV